MRGEREPANVGRWLAELMHDLLSVRLARERRIAQAILGAARPALQPGLFDRRAERTRVADKPRRRRIRGGDRRLDSRLSNEAATSRDAAGAAAPRAGALTCCRDSRGISCRSICWKIVLSDAVSDAAATGIDLARKQLGRWRRDCEWLGPASTVQTLFEAAAVPLVDALGFDAPSRVERAHGCVVATIQAGREPVVLLVSAWDERLDPLWRTAVIESIRRLAAWSILFNGTHLRLVDAGRALRPPLRGIRARCSRSTKSGRSRRCGLCCTRRRSTPVRPAIGPESARSSNDPSSTLWRLAVVARRRPRGVR